jgi:hypothetical protein
LATKSAAIKSVPGAPGTDFNQICRINHSGDVNESFFIKTYDLLRSA